MDRIEHLKGPSTDIAVGCASTERIKRSRRTYRFETEAETQGVDTTWQSAFLHQPCSTHWLTDA